jgi:hypothetical protein
MKPARLIQLSPNWWDVICAERFICAEINYNAESGFYFVWLAGDMECEHFRTFAEARAYAFGGEP